MTSETQAPDEDRYHVHNSLEVAQILNDLAKHKVMLKASFNHGHDGYLTTVIEADPHARVAYLDISADEGFNQRLVADHHVLFTKDGGVRVRWQSANLKLVQLKDGPALKIALPQNLLYVQRREFHRLRTPRMAPVLCRVPIVGEDGAENEKTITLTDVSIGGIGAFSTELNDTLWQVGAEFQNCKIAFPDVGTTNLTLRIRNMSIIDQSDGPKRVRMGLEFIDPSRGNQGLIQRYVFNLEKEEAALLARQG